MRDRLQSTECARYLKALAEPERLKIIQCLESGPKNVSQLAGLLGQGLAQVSHHLGILRHAGLVRNRKAGKYVIYELHPDIYFRNAEGTGKGVLDLGCCRLELGRR
jgi:ArsR family transcriptional regulator, nickel/cobalt-responsive transcriptional repressor